MPRTTARWLNPSLWRVVVFSLILALLANTLLWSISARSDEFAEIIAVASGIAAALLLLAWYRFTRWLEFALLAIFAIWMANAIEFATEDFPSWESKFRQCGFYLSQALLALGAYVAHRITTDHNGR